MSATGPRMIQAKVNPNFLHANSTSHTWPFSAVAELIDNAYDPDVSASDLWIDHLKVNGKACLVFRDNGAGMDLQHLQYMLSFGFCEKERFEQKSSSHAPIGHYGNGFKSGSMRLAKDALVLTVHRASQTASLGFLSQTLCLERRLEAVVLPLMEFMLPEFKRSDNEDIDMDSSLAAILEFTPYSSEEELVCELQQLSRQKKRSGTKIVLFNLKWTTTNMLELDFESCQDDIRNPETHEDRHQAIQQESKVWEYRQSLRKYCSILYKKPRMKIHIRGTQVDHFLITEKLTAVQAFKYKPKGKESSAEIKFGRIRKKEKERLEDFGIMFYHRNRLIEPYVKIGPMKEDGKAVGVVGIVDVTDVLQPIHNKQEFQTNTVEYRSTIKALVTKLDVYCGQRKADDNEDERNRWDWVQCDNCRKWRRLPVFANPHSLPKEWFCYMNPDCSRNRCEFEEEQLPDEYDLPETSARTRGGKTPQRTKTGRGGRKNSTPTSSSTVDVGDIKEEATSSLVAVSFGQSPSEQQATADEALAAAIAELYSSTIPTVFHPNMQGGQKRTGEQSGRQERRGVKRARGDVEGEGVTSLEPNRSRGFNNGRDTTAASDMTLPDGPAAELKPRTATAGSREGHPDLAGAETTDLVAARSLGSVSGFGEQGENERVTGRLTSLVAGPVQTIPKTEPGQSGATAPLPSASRQPQSAPNSSAATSSSGEIAHGQRMLLSSDLDDRMCRTASSSNGHDHQTQADRNARNRFANQSPIDDRNRYRSQLPPSQELREVAQQVTQETLAWNGGVKSSASSLPGTSQSADRQATVSSTGSSSLCAMEGQHVDMNLNQRQCCMILRRRLHRFLTYLAESSMIDVGEIGSETEVEATLLKVMAFFGMDPE